jgi:hypothetical protein
MHHPPSVIIRDNFNDFLDGKEVKATFIHPTKDAVWPGAHVLAFKHSIASENDVPVPRSQQSHYIGIEGTIIEVGGSPLDKKDSPHGPTVIVKKL